MDGMPEDIQYYKEIDFTNTNLLSRSPYKLRRSPIMVTLSDPEITPVDIQKIMEAGMNVARFTMSHSTKEDKIKLLGKIEKAAAVLAHKHDVLDWPVATAVELKTCIVKTGILETENEHVIIKEGNQVTLIYALEEYNKCNGNKIFIDSPYLSKDIKVGTDISIDQDEIILSCKQIRDDKTIKCSVVKGGKLTSLCLVSIRNNENSTALITKKDFDIIKFAQEYQLDMIIINYARRSDTVRKVKQYIGKKVKRPIIICGISSSKDLINLDELIKESDGIIFSREFLTYVLDKTEKHRVLQIQKWVGAKCQQAGKPYYISGGVFQETLINGNSCDNEISDITNALLDGATGFVLTDTNEVDFTIAAIKYINDLCRTVEPFTNVKRDFVRILEEIKMPVNAAEASALSCAAVANQTNSRVIVLPTVTGRTAKVLLYLRPCCIIITVSNSTRTTRLLNTYRCVVPLMYKGPALEEWRKTIESRIDFAVEYAVKKGWLEYGDTYISLQKGSEGSSFCDTVRIQTVSIKKKTNIECPDSSDDEM